MELSVNKDPDQDAYYIAYDHYTVDNAIARRLGIPCEDFERILTNYGAFYHIERRSWDLYGHYYFNSKEEAEKVVEILEPYLIMKKLTE